MTQLSLPLRKPGAFHFARLESSPRLRRLLAYLRERGECGATTLEIVTGAHIAAVSAAVSELRCNGFTIDCASEGVTGSTARVFRYTLREGGA